MNDVRIAAYGWVLPGELDWPDLLGGRSAVVELPPAYPVRVGAPVPLSTNPPSDWAYSLFPRVLGLIRTALDRLDYDPDRRYGLVLGLPNLYSQADYLDACHRYCQEDGPVEPMLAFSQHVPLMAVADWLNLSADAPCLRVDSACATGGDAMVVAAQWLEAGCVEDVVVIAASAMLNPVGTALFHNLKALNPHADLTASCPYDARRRGFVMGEAAAALWMTRDPQVPALGILRGYGQSMNADHFVEPPADVAAMATAANAALAGEQRVAYVSGHGTATPLNDIAEAKLHRAVFGAAAGEVPISSVKSMVGHTLGAAALIEAIVCVEALRHQKAPPTINFQSADPEIPLWVVPNQWAAIHGDLALSYSFAFGGHNNCLLFSRGDV